HRVLGTMEDERKTYRDLFRHAVALGKLTPKVREVLEDARRLLRVTKPEADRIEREILADAPVAAA
ncbi:MAG TPA: hypothetical protein VEM95_01305, partial [Thermoplasmata archaeon]|nr:hypothetical protein [Thermoplasmata archaeon]